MKLSQNIGRLFLLLLICLLFLPMQRIRGQTPSGTQPQLVKQVGHNQSLFSEAFSPDGQYVLTGGKDGSVCLWETTSGLEVRRFKTGTSIGGVRSVAFSPDERFVLASISVGDTIPLTLLWETATGREARRLEGMSNPAGFSPDGRFVLTASKSGNKVVRLWDVSSGKEVRQFKGYNPAAFSPDGRFIFAANAFDEPACLWESSTGREVQRFEGHKLRLVSVAFSPDGRFVLTAGSDGSIRLSEMMSGLEVRRFETHTSLAISAFVAFSPDGRFVLGTALGGGKAAQIAQLWETATGREVRQFEGHNGYLTSGAFSPDGRFVLTTGLDNIALLWEISTGHLVQRFGGYTESLSSASISPDGRFVLTGGVGGSAHLWDVSVGGEVRRFEGHIQGVTSVAFSNDGRFVVTGSYDKTARLWETSTGRLVQSFEGHKGEISSVALSPPDGRFILTSSDADNVQLWEVSTKQMVRQFADSVNDFLWLPTTFVPPPFPVAFSPDGRFVLVGSRSADNKTARLWEIATGLETRRFEGHKEGVYSVAFSRDGRHVLTGSWDHTALLWETATEREVQRFEGHTGVVSSVAFSPDGRYVLTGSWDHTARLWEIATGLEVRRFKGHADIVISVTFSPDGHHVLTGSQDGSARLWDASTGNELAELVNFWNAGWAVISPNGRFDVNNLEEIRGLHWIMQDDPLKPLPPETFMRDYYEPQLLPKILSGKAFKPIRQLAELNRVQPGVKILGVERGTSPDIAKVTVEVSAAEGTFRRDGKDVVMKTGVHDLRLYRNGQLVGQWPEAGELTYKSLNTTSEEELNAWRKATEIRLEKKGKATKTFTVRLARREDLKEVDFAAYAFNLDRVKSETARQTYTVPGKLKTIKGRAYVITVGVSGNEDMAWRLTAPAQDAQLIQEMLAKNLEDSRRYKRVVLIPLITVPAVSDFDDEEALKARKRSINPTKENIRAVIDVLAGRKIAPSRLKLLPAELRNELHPVQPEDLVIFSFSSHGVTDANGEFYILPYDLGTGSGGKVTSELLKRSISSQELSLWLSGVDAEQMFMIVDACHSAAAVDVEGFKPGPMGNPGLGQLSYDKKMPILTATQATDSAWAKGYSLLSYALAKEGIGEKQLALAEAMKYAESRVPKLYEEVLGKERKGQVPKLFVFERQQPRSQKY